jgi:VRR-NUC domain
MEARHASDWIDRVGAKRLGLRPVVATARKHPEVGAPVVVEHVAFAFRSWDEEIGAWHEHFGKRRGQAYSLDGTDPLRSCNEVEVAKKLRAVHQHAYWFSQYQPTLVPESWRPWVRSLGTHAPAWLIDLDHRVRPVMRSPRGGMPDVVAWNDVEPLASAVFVECKGLKEPFLEAQEDWVAAAVPSGVGRDQLAVSVR